jgi:predicted NBD/HSP70 family sugar kinase
MPTEIASMQNETSREVASVVRDHGPIGRAQIARRLKLSASTVGRTVDRLIAQGILSELGPQRGSGSGRPSTLLCFNSEIASVLVADLRLTEAYVVRTDLGGNLLRSAVRPRGEGDTPLSLTQLITLLRQELEGIQSGPPVRAVVIGAPSVVDPEHGLVEWAPSLGWSNVPLASLLKDELGLPVSVENDVNLAALGEYWKGVGRGSRHMVFVSVGTGIGAGIILDGRLYHGGSNAAGEVSYFVTDVSTLQDNAGQIGTLESRVGREGVIRMAHLLAQRYPASRLATYIHGSEGHILSQDIFALALGGDPAAQVVFKETVDQLSVVMCNLSVVLDPEVVVLGGPDDWKWPSLVEAIRARIGSALLRPINLQATVLGRDAVILGGAHLALSVEGVLPV